MENRETFFARLTPFMPPSELRKVEVAYMMSKFGHRAQLRKEKDEKGNPVRYFEHCRRVALILIDKGEVRDWRLICAALLHDVLEDTRDITEEIIEHLFDARVCQIVKLLSKRPKEGYLDRLQKFGDADVYLIKAADRLDNLSHMETVTVDFINKQVTETEDKLMPIFRQAADHRVTKLFLLINVAIENLKQTVVDHKGI